MKFAYIFKRHHVNNTVLDGFHEFFTGLCKSIRSYFRKISKSVLQVEFLPFFLLKAYYILKTEFNIVCIQFIEDITGLPKIYQMQTFLPFFIL